MSWQAQQPIESRAFTCGYCGNIVASAAGFCHAKQSHRRIYLCPHCDNPSFFTPNRQLPGVAPGNEVKALPSDIEALYREARNCVAASAYTGSVLISRKILMNTAVAQGAKPNLGFLDYVQYLADNGYVPPKGRGWVDHIRKKGNEATHEIAAMSEGDAQELVAFLEMLLKFIYEFPSKVPNAP